MMSFAKASRDEHKALVKWLKSFCRSLRVRTIRTEADHNSELFHDRQKKDYPVAQIEISNSLLQANNLVVTITPVSANPGRKAYPIALYDISEQPKSSLTINGPFLQYEIGLDGSSLVEICFDHIEVRQIKRQLEKNVANKKSNTFNDIFFTRYGIVPDFSMYPETYYYGMIFKHIHNLYGNFDPFGAGFDHFDGLGCDKKRTELNKCVKPRDKQTTFYLCFVFRFMHNGQQVHELVELVPITDLTKSSHVMKESVQMPVQTETQDSRAYMDSATTSSSAASSQSTSFDDIPEKEPVEVGNKSKKMRVVNDNEPQAEESSQKLDEWIDFSKYDLTEFDPSLVDFIESTNFPFNSSNVEQNYLPNIPNEMTQNLGKSTFENDIDYWTQTSLFSPVS